MAKKIISCTGLVLVFSALAALHAPETLAAPAKKDYQALTLYSNQAMVVDQSSGKVLYDKNADTPKPIASITKLMTAIVTLDAELPMGEKIAITKDDIDTLRNSRSRLKVGPKHSRRELLQLALMSSENRAASALARSYPGGRSAFITAMNKKAKALGMNNSHFRDSTGLDSGNVSTARDLVKLVQAGFEYTLIREITTDSSYDLKQGSIVKYKNSNPLFKDKNWQIGLSKTGYIIPAGHCLVMQTKVDEQPLIIVLLDANARGTVSADSNRIKKWFAKLFGSHKFASTTTSDAISDVLAKVAVDEEVAMDDASVSAAKVRTTFQPVRPLSIESEVNSSQIKMQM
jgi:D-alanyl-D-alanine endopeptidase (penicillin-binding protein 7)